jgi:hypothetical protein
MIKLAKLSPFSPQCVAMYVMTSRVHAYLAFEPAKNLCNEQTLSVWGLMCKLQHQSMDTKHHVLRRSGSAPDMETRQDTSFVWLVI